MKPGSKVIASHDIGSVRGRATSNPNLDPDLINKRFEEAESVEKEKTMTSVPVELKGLEDLIFLGSSSRDVNIGNFSFTLATLSSREQEVVFKNALKVPEQERLLLFKRGMLALSLKKINGKKIETYFEDDSFDSRNNLIGNLQQSVFDILFSEFEKLTEETSKILTAENLKK
jgi:hypothetical protein